MVLLRFVLHFNTQVAKVFHTTPFSVYLVGLYVKSFLQAVSVHEVDRDVNGLLCNTVSTGYDNLSSE